MAEFRLRKREKLEQDAQPGAAAPGAVVVPETPSLLGHIGSAVHTLGSILSTPSRVLHGTINAATGGEGGFGNMNPLDSTGGIEMSRHLIRAGILPENDPTQWELHDLTRGVADMAGDPTIFLSPLGLTAKGAKLAQSGKLASGLGAQIRGGERALLTARVPFQGVVGAVGHGPDVADALATAGRVTGATRVGQAIAGSKPVRVARGIFDSAMEGVTHPLLQKLMPERFTKLARSHKRVQEALVRIGRELQPLDEAARLRGEKFLPSQQVHSALEGVTKVGPELQRHVDELRSLFDERLKAEQAYGTGWRGPLKDPAINGYGPRYKSMMAGDKLAGGSGSASVMGRQDMLKGFYKGTHAPGGVNDVMQKVTEFAHAPGMETLSRKDRIAKIVEYLKANHAGDVEATYTTKPMKVRLEKIGGKWMRVTKDGQYKRYKIPSGRERAVHGGRTKTVDINGNPVKVTIGGTNKRYKVPKGTPDEWKQVVEGGKTTWVKTGEKTRIIYEPRTVNRYKELAKYAIDNPDLATRPLFGNNPLADIGRSLSGSYLRQHNAETVADALAQGLQAPGTDGRTLRDLFKGKQGLKYRDQMIEQIASRKGINLPDKTVDAAGWKQGIDHILDHTIDPEIAKELKFARPRSSMTSADEHAANWWQQGLNLFKSGVLAFPASRMRDLASGYVQNLLRGWGLPGSGAYTDAKRLMTGQTVKHDYSHVREVADWLTKTGRANTPENQTEALRQLVAVHLPREHGFLGDLPGGQTGFTLDDVLRNVPGQRQSTITQQFITNPLNTLKSLFTNREARNPLNVRGVGGRAETGFAPIKASEQFSEASDVLNRGAGFLDQLRKGTDVDVAARNVNRAQIDYNPATFSAREKWIKRNFAPFYSFTSRIVPETAKQLSDFGSPTSQLLKTQTRAFGGNPAVPDYVLDSSGVPIRKLDDGSLEYLTGLGLMHEPATKILGQAVTGATTGDLRPLGLNALSQLNPFISHPLEQISGVSYAREGDLTANMESNSGRLLSNMAVLAGLRHPDAGPVKFAGQSALDFVGGLTPVDRLLSTARQLTDTRRGVGKLIMQNDPITAGQAAYELGVGVGPAVSGLRITDISPAKQLVTLRQRAEKIAQEAGARTRNDVYFSRAERDKMKVANPALAAKQEEIQRLLNSLKAGRQVKPGVKQAVGRLRKREKEAKDD